MEYRTKKWLAAAMCCITLCGTLTACGSSEKVQGTEETQESVQESELWINGRPENSTLEGERAEDGMTSDGHPESGMTAEGDAQPGGEARAGLIEDQTFKVDLKPLGDVTFASYEPDTDLDPCADVVFELQRDGQAIDTLEGVFEDNIRENEVFSKVEAVSFPDYNSDGYSDIIILCSYSMATGPQAGNIYPSARIYRGNADGSFVLEKELSDSANAAVADKTVKTILGFLGADKGAYGSADSGWKQAYISYVQQLDAGPWQGYDLIYVNDDDIPELVEIGNSEAMGCRIVSYSDGKMVESQLSRLGFSYIERENLLCNSDGHMDYYYDVVYRLENGRLVETAAGYFGAEDNSNVQFDENQNPIYQYEWNGVMVTMDEYSQALNAVYDTTRAKDGYAWEKWLSREQVIETVQAL